MVEELLQFLIGEVNANLFETVRVEDFKTGNIQYTNEKGAFLFSLQGLVTTCDQVQEELVEHGFGQGGARIQALKKSIFITDISTVFYLENDLRLLLKLFFNIITIISTN